MGASTVSIGWVIGVTLFFGLIALLISPFSAIFVIVAGIVFGVFVLVWGRRGQTGDIEGPSETPSEYAREQGGAER